MHSLVLCQQLPKILAHRIIMSRIQERDTNSLYPGALDWRSSINWVCPTSHNALLTLRATILASTQVVLPGIISAHLHPVHSYSSYKTLHHPLQAPTAWVHISVVTSVILPCFISAHVAMFFISRVKIFNVKINNPNSTRGNEIKSKINSLSIQCLSPEANIINTQCESIQVLSIALR